MLGLYPISGRPISGWRKIINIILTSTAPFGIPLKMRGVIEPIYIKGSLIPLKMRGVIKPIHLKQETEPLKMRGIIHELFINNL